MKFSATITGAALLATGASAGKATVTNNCAAPFYVQSFPYDGSTPGPLTQLQPGQAFQEDFRLSGSTVKIDTDKTLAHPLFFGYSFTSSPDYVYYELSSEWGNPFGKSHNILTPGTGCEVFDCPAFDPGSYSRPEAKKVYGCPQPVDLTLSICV
ncbi:hypothetical protein GGS26DRAFT_570707 [Hypomontagnella submonticulosa]|nr:hypothetical protein GGS26DRAFT_570707 [Hypomontagnella submonticulosa]